MMIEQQMIACADAAFKSEYNGATIAQAYEDIGSQFNDPVANLVADLIQMADLNHEPEDRATFLANELEKAAAAIQRIARAYQRKVRQTIAGV